MSMSSLSAQLASLNNSASGGKNVGSSLGTSKRHEDAIGRGVGHSSKLGHTLQSTSALHKPSVLYADSKTASDVPLTTLRENCVSSLRQLSKLTGNDDFVDSQFLNTLAGIHSLQFERGLTTRAENEKMDAIIVTLLSLLSTTLGEKSASSTPTTCCFSSSLHVLEYLLRRYQVHARLETSEKLLQAVLPHHEEPVFLRILQLVDLASLPTYTFLRPYAAPGASAPPRRILAQRASKDTVILRECCALAQSASRIHASECEGEEGPSAPRRGISLVISFAAAVVVQALSLQSTNHGTIEEPTLRCVLPFVMSACGDTPQEGSNVSLASRCPDWRGFGYVLASCISEQCVLAANIKELLSTALAKGALETYNVLESLDGMHGEEFPEPYEAVADALLCVMTVLPPEGDDNTNQLMMVSKETTKATPCGMTLPVATFKVLVKLQCLSQSVGHMHEDRAIDVSPFVASLIAVSLSRLEKERAKSSNQSLRLILDLIQEKNLLSLWKDPHLNLTASVASAVVITSAVAASENSDAGLEMWRQILDSLREVDSTGCDTGIAHAVTASFSRKRSSSIKKRISSLLGLSPNAQDSDIRSSVGRSPDESSALLLPPRVALEHAEVRVRLNAIERIRAQPMSIMNADGNVEEALVRHLYMENEPEVAIAAGSALVERLKTKNTLQTDYFMNMARSALLKWSFSTDNVSEKSTKKESSKPTIELSEDRLEVLELCLIVAGYAAGALEKGTGSAFEETFESLVMPIIAHLDLDRSGTNEAEDDRIRMGASSALHLCLEQERGSSRRGAKADTGKLLLSNDILDGMFRRNVVGTGFYEPERKATSSTQIYQRYLRVYLKNLHDGLAQPVGKTSQVAEAQVLDALHVCLTLLSCTPTGWTGQDTNTVLSCIDQCAKNISAVDPSQLPGLFTSFASIRPKHNLKEVAIPAIDRLCKGLAASAVVSPVMILMEASLRDGVSEKAAYRMVSIASEFYSHESNMTKNGAVTCIIPALALLGQDDQKIRSEALQLLAKIGDSLGGSATGDGKAIKKICSYAADEKMVSVIRLGGTSVLPSFVTTCVQGSDTPQIIRTFLLQQCALLVAPGEGENMAFLSRTGRCRASTMVLNALELSGEAVFPLSQRWKLAGKEIFGALQVVQDDEVAEIPPVVLDLIGSVSRMLKGVKVDDATSLREEMSSIVISTGPSRRGTRARSYSVGRTHGVSLLTPYPKEMVAAIKNSLSYEGHGSITKALCSYVVRDVIGSQSWGQGIFLKLKDEARLELASCLLSLRESSNEASEVLLGLPLGSSDVISLFDKQEVSDDTLASIAFLADFIRTRSEQLSADSNVNELKSRLFNMVKSLSSSMDAKISVDGLEFVLHSIILALLKITKSEDHSASASRKKRRTPSNQDLSSFADLLVQLVGHVDSLSVGDVRPVLSTRTRTSVLSLLTTLCEKEPDSVVASLVPAVLSTSVSACMYPDVTPGALKSARESLVAVVPVYCAHAKMAGLSISELLDPYIKASFEIQDDTVRTEICGFMVEALDRITLPDESSFSPVGCFVSKLLAAKVSSPEHTTEVVASTLAVLQYGPISIQMQSALQIIAYAYGFTLKLAGQNQSDVQKMTSMEGDIDTIMSGRDDALVETAINLLNLLQDLLASEPIEKSIQKAGATESMLSLQLWQDLLIIQSSLVHSSIVDDQNASNISVSSFLDTARITVNKSLDHLQNLLPAHLFLASVTSLVRDSADVDIQSKAVRLIADKASEIDATSAEASLFLDMIPMLVELLESNVEEQESTWLLKQSVLLSAETLARSLCLGQTDTTNRKMNGFVTILEHSTQFLKSHASSLTDLNTPFDQTSCQLVCSSALCASTLVRLLQARSLPLLPKLVRPLLSALFYANESSDKGDLDSSQVKLLQLSVLRALVAVADSLPKFLAPYLDQLFMPCGLPSASLRRGEGENDVAVESTAESLERTLSSKIPARQLIPAICKALSGNNTMAVTEKLALLSMLKESITLSNRTELSGLRNWVLKAITNAYEYEGSREDRAQFLASANEVLLELVLKLSETQLRSLYASLREWRGEKDTDGKTGTALALRKQAFWALSSVLGRELRVIFLPYLSTVVADAVGDLNEAVAKLCRSAALKIDDGKKRRRLGTEKTDETGDSSDPMQLAFLQPLLLCLENGLKTDAHEGGAWARAGDGQRYTSLLEPLASLLQCHVSSDIPLANTSSTSTAFEKLVEGDRSGQGSVVGCLTALASAAGNEQLWKPLNHGVLEACGNERRSEVRKAGVGCLLSLIKTLGEEYMVLLPECLPVLSELLEDGDEDIVSLAQECVDLGEELLGESLQDSLR